MVENMAFVIVNTTHQEAENSLRRWEKGEVRRDSAQKHFIRQLGPGLLMKANEQHWIVVMI